MSRDTASTCWICGDPAQSAEHIPKASDMRRYFGTPTQKNPLYFHSEAKKNIPIQGIRSNRLKSKAAICAKCNNDRTQPYDLAWEQLSGYLDSNSEVIARRGAFDLRKPYQAGSFRKQALYAHLFFVKLFGCRIAESGTPIDLSGFRNSLLHAIPHPDVLLAFSISLTKMPIQLLQIGAIHAAETGKRVSSAAWEYSIGPLCVIVAYYAAGALPNPYPRSWHPDMPGRVIRLARPRFDLPFDLVVDQKGGLHS